MVNFSRLTVPARTVVAGLALGAVAGLFLAQLQPGVTLAAVLNLEPADVGTALDTHLAKIDGDYFVLGVLPGASLEPQASATVRKIGYGRTSIVTVSTTASGTYSTDGLVSPNVRYPGIISAPLEVEVTPLGEVLGWSKLSGWVQLPLPAASSIGFLDDAATPAGRDGVCVTDSYSGGCR